MSRESDQHARKQAVRSYERNVVVLASAGTGKTSLIVERFLNQVIEQDLPLREVAAITFSEKAATEMRLRVARAFELLASAVPPADPAEEAARSWAYLRDRVGAASVFERAGRALRELPVVTISTIHGFCARILRQQAHRLGLRPDFRVDEGFGYEQLKLEAWETFLEGARGPGGPARELWLHALERLDLRELRELAFRLAGFNFHDARTDLGLPDSRVVLGPQAGALIARIEGLLREGLPTEVGVGSYLESARCSLAAFLSDGPDALRAVAEENPFVTSQRNESSVLVAPSPRDRKHPDATACAEQVSRLLRNLARVDDEATARAFDLILPFAQAARARAIREGRLPFDALLSLTRELLVRDEDVRRHLGSRFRLILVDEFQDTSPLQYEIVFFLAEDPGRERAEDAFRTQLTPGKLFIVGDPKQSIYGFRDADIAACQRAIQHVEREGGIRLSLTTTWRAVPELVEPLDRLFRRVFEVEPDGDPNLHPVYDGMESGRKGVGGDRRVEVWTVAAGGAEKPRAEEARRQEAMATAEWIAQWIRGDAVPERRYRDIAILLRSFTQVHLYAHALRQCGIPFTLERPRNLFEQPEAQQLWALLRAIARPTDAPAVLGVLRSALGAVPDSELARYASSTPPCWCYMETDPDPSRFPALARTFEWLRRWHERAQQTPGDRLVTALLDESLILPLHASAQDGRPRAAMLRHLTARIASLARTEPSWPLARVLDAFDVVQRESARVGEGGAEGSADAVQLLTFHAAKGLEFPVVFLPDLARSRSGQARRSTREAHAGTLEEPRGHWVRIGPLRSALCGVAEEHDQERDRAESRRLFYVACTRAREQLIFVHAPRARRESASWIEFLEPLGYTGENSGDGAPLPRENAVLHRLVSLPEPQTTPVANGEPQDWAESISRAERAAEQARAAARPIFHRPSGLREEQEAREELGGDDDAQAREFGTSAARPRAVGIAVHEVLERWDFRDPQIARTRANAAAQRAARAMGLDVASVVAATREVLDAFLETELPAYLASAEILGREVPFLLEDGGRRWTGTIDLIYRQPDGALVVADYKTDREISERALENYREQLAVYARAVARALPDEPGPRVELLFVRGGNRIHLLE